MPNIIEMTGGGVRRGVLDSTIHVKWIADSIAQTTCGYQLETPLLVYT